MGGKEGEWVGDETEKRKRGEGGGAIYSVYSR